MEHLNFTKQNMGGPMMAVDALGRRIADRSGGIPPTKKDRLVGLFYFLWLGEEGHLGPYDISKILKIDPDAGHKPDSPLWGSVGVYHHWGEPFYGYYYSNDEWVVRRHMKLFIQAGIDFLYFDVTNNGHGNKRIYRDNAALVMRIAQEYHDAGFNAPKVVFYAHNVSGQTIRAVYDEFYAKGLYPDSWMYLNGKPVIVGDPEDCDADMLAYFTVKRAQWPTEPDQLDGWPWMDFARPQHAFYNADHKLECINVSVAQHPQIRFGDSVLYGETANRGRGFHNGANDPDPEAWKYGYNFAEQFDRALEVDPPIVLLTGWNEWIAGRWPGWMPGRPIMFVDCANGEYSRDVEMMRGGYFDNYYMQMVDYVRRYKGASETPVYSVGEVATYDGFTDGDMPRCAEGQGGVIYENRTQSNAITRVNVSHDDEAIHFTVTTKDAVKENTDGALLWVFLNTLQTVGYQYILKPTASGRATLAHVLEAGESLAAEDVAELACTIDGDTLNVSVPRALVGLNTPDFTLWFKVADATEPYTAIEDFYDKGDVLPLGRLNFVYRGE